MILEPFVVVTICIMAVAVALIAAIQIYKIRKNNKGMTMDQFIDAYGSQIIRILKDVVIIEQSILKINPNLFENKEDYEKAIINTALEKLIENSEDFGIDPSIVGIFDVNTLTNIIHSIFVSHKIDIYSSVEPSDIAEHSELYDEDVATALKGAE